MRSSDARGGVERGRPRARAKVDANARRPDELDADAETAEATRLLLRCAKREEDSHSSPSASTPHPTTTSPASSAPAASRSSGASLLFLGTGSAEPSKYRGASGVLATLPRSGGNAVAPLLSDDGGYLVDSFEKSAAPSVSRDERRERYLLLDAGEGCLGAMTRLLGDAATDAVVRRLAAVWISHAHADHALGLRALVAARGKHTAGRSGGGDCGALLPPLAIVGPRSIERWLARSQPATEPGFERGRAWTFVDARTLEAGGRGAAGPFRLPRAQEPPTTNAFAENGPPNAFVVGGS